MNPNDDSDIRNLIARVAHLTDKWDSEKEYVFEYTEDCIWHLEGFEPYHGHSGLIRRLREMLAARVCGPGLSTRHCITSLEVIADAAHPDAALARSFVIMMSMQNNVPIIYGYGEMEDTVRRVEGKWKIAVRKGKAFSGSRPSPTA